ncbi:hypothetical protein F7725_006488 [Dissostichus mawsoni]|uniref:Ubiquitin carboxyl-terminal hydrolase n=1 Tax=Dissostichus mawsoni TaxID=36200 RepID=A0A7J5XU14_DISMA|nr:hypothetical protein F7725_006488 [Dissostichus mawsoni]
MRGEQIENRENSTNSSEILMKQLREITGIQDSQILCRALNSSRILKILQSRLQRPGTNRKESQNAQEEEREFNRALEASAEENAARMKRKRSEAQSDMCNPAEWIRQDEWPVGIRNVGNTCWFSAVIQSLFHLPVFRRLVLNYHLSERILEKCKSHSDKRNMAFMQELRCLFALMVGSSRTFVDPSAAVELLRDAFRTSEAQQDVSEFSHKLLDWLEDAFQLAAKELKVYVLHMQGLFSFSLCLLKVEDKQKNPMVQLFYGTFVTERRHEGKTLCNIEQFGQYPLQVNGFNNLDECLEGAMRWFKKLPPVLTFELSRFEFNTQLGRPEKIHKKLEYLHKNISQTHERRGDYPLADMLQFVLEFATTKPSNVSPAEDLRAASPASPLPNEPLPKDNSEPTDADSSEDPVAGVSSCQRTPIYKPFTQCRLPIDCPPHPAPHSVTEEELHFVKSCLQRWRTEVPYRLHAVLVHEGQASAGHYWAYIYDHANKRWMKYNDVSITESSWEELERDSFGGMTNASAYCLMYIDDRLPTLTTEATDDETGQVLHGIESLPPVLRRYVSEDNRWFQQELSEWEEQFCQTAAPQGGSTDPRPEKKLQTAVEPALQSGPSEEELEEEEASSEPQPDPEAEKDPEPDPREKHEEESEVSPPPPQIDSSSKAVTDTLDPSQSPNQSEKELQSQRDDTQTVARVPHTAGGSEASRETPEEEEEQQEVPVRENVVSEVEIPNMMLTPAMQGVILAIAKARQIFDKEGPEAGLIKEETTPSEDVRLQHSLVYFFQNKAPNRIVERTLLEQFTDRNLSFDERAISIMREARTKLRLIKPEDMDMDEYLQWHDDYRLFRTVFVYLLTGLEHYQHGKMREALIFLAHAYETNSALLKHGERRGLEKSLISVYRRKCLTCGGGCFHHGGGCDPLPSPDESRAESDPRGPGCHGEHPEPLDRPQRPPKVPVTAAHDLCSRLAAVMESLHKTSVVSVK